MKSFTAIITLLLAPTIFVAAAPAGDINTALEARKIADLNSLLQGVDLKGGNVQEIVKGAIGQVVDQAKAKIGDKLKGLEGKVGDKVKAKIGDALKGLEGQAGNKLSGLLGGLLGGNKAKPAPALVEPVIADDSA